MTAIERYAVHSEMFAALADRTRHAPSLELREGGPTVSSLADRLGGSRPDVSQHLAVMSSHGLMRRRTEGSVLWFVTEPCLARAYALIDEVFGDRP